MKVLLFAQGPGESCHAYGMAQYLVAQNHQIVFALGQEINRRFYDAVPFLQPIVTPDVAALRALVDRTQPTIVLLCNSKIFNHDDDFVMRRPWPMPTFGVDSNWLFEASGPVRCLQWVDGYFALFPPAVFQLGFVENGGHFTIPAHQKARITPVGFLPSYQKPEEPIRQHIRQQLGIRDEDKLIFCYVSGHGAGLRSYVLQHLFEAVSQLRYEGYVIKVCVIGNLKLLQHHFPAAIADWLLFREMTADNFYAHLASSDLVFQHQGLATLAQAISAQIPVIAHVQEPHRFDQKWVEPGELPPLQRAGLCKLFCDTTPIEEIRLAVESLLYDQEAISTMQQAQITHFLPGEPSIYSLLMDHLATDSPPAFVGEAERV